MSKLGKGSHAYDIGGGYIARQMSTRWYIFEGETDTGYDFATLRECRKWQADRVAVALTPGAALNALRKTKSGGKNGGRPKLLSPCPKCGKVYGVVEMLEHKRECK